MGQSHIIVVDEDGLEGAWSSASSYERPLGSALLELCLDRPIRVGGELKVVKSRTVLGHDHCVIKVAAVQSTETRVFFWFHNNLRRLGDLNESDLETLKHVVEEEIGRRAQPRDA